MLAPEVASSRAGSNTLEEGLRCHIQRAHAWGPLHCQKQCPAKLLGKWGTEPLPSSMGLTHRSARLLEAGDSHEGHQISCIGYKTFTAAWVNRTVKGFLRFLLFVLTPTPPPAPFPLCNYFVQTFYLWTFKIKGMLCLIYHFKEGVWDVKKQRRQTNRTNCETFFLGLPTLFKAKCFEMFR